MKKDRFLWSAHRITERQKAGKARSIKGKQLKNSRNTVSKQLVELLSSQRDNQFQQFSASYDVSEKYITPQDFLSWGVFCATVKNSNAIITLVRQPSKAKEVVRNGHE